MKYISDLHIHSRFSRATSKSLDLANLEKWARIKGVNILGTGDFTHPEWIKEIKQNLTERDGILFSKTDFPFVLQSEVSLMYSQGGKGRRIHVVLLAPNLDVVDQMTSYFKTLGRIDYDGRPIFGKNIIEVTESLKNISDEIEIIPAHAWTPYFGLLGSKSGFDSFEEAFGDQVKNIYALETGLSSDPEMNWRLSSLDKYSLVSFSDLHSFWPWRIGREATIFDLKKLTYQDLIKAIRTKEGLVSTVEVDPNYGKYHFSGHRNCNVSLSPEETRKNNNICPTCGNPLTIGVLNRVEELADRPEGFKPKDAKEFYKLLPLSELISTIHKSGVASKKVWEIYNNLIKEFNSEFNILLEVPESELKKIVDPKLAEFILKNRKGEIVVKAGYDGVYGEAMINGKQPVQPARKPLKMQKSILEFR